MFGTVLVANRGEIACRILAALRERGIRSVAVYSEADANAPHRHLADEAIAIGPPPVAESYLRAGAIIEAAREAHAEAIHPGYGLLSECADFARACAREGIVFIGPSPEAMEAVADKAKAREIARAAAIPVVPGSSGPVDDADAPAIAERLGYPVIVKASAGGGGIGMTVVEKASMLDRGLRSSRDRGRSSFGSSDVYLEKLIAHPRHIEVQVLGDHAGTRVHLFERECTLQRRHQKVVEEAPSPFVAERPELRSALTSAALRLAEAVDYHNAGTVEFIVDPAGNFYFIEMNTRLQVEHAVTEAITGIDIIGCQLAIAAKIPLEFGPGQIAITGAAIECRLYAEDPARGFLPRPGTLDRFVAPRGDGVRLDSGVRSGQEITPYYDPLLAKLITHGASRKEATERMRDALAQTQVSGLTTNLSFLREVLAHDDFARAAFDTGWLVRLAKQAQG